MPESDVLSVRNLSKNYGYLPALRDVSFSVSRGTVFGILGPNGSGKTTLLGIITDVLKASAGGYFWNGLPGSAKQRKIMGTLLETPNFYPYLSAERNLEIAAAIKERGKGDIENVLRTVNLYERRKSKFNTYSLGMKQRLAIASALLGDPDVLVFDEPTNGLDPAGIAEIRELIIALNQKGKTIIMASHILDEVEKVCTHVAIIQKGILKSSGSVSGVLESTQSVFEISSVDMVALKQLVSHINGVESVHEGNNELLLYCNGTITADYINRYCFENGIVLNKLFVKRKSLETRFLEITGKNSES